MKSLFFNAFFFILYLPLSAQYIVVNDSYSAQQLIENILINSPCANVSNFSATGWNSFPSYGYFNKVNSNFPFNEGVVLTTGKAVSAIGPNTSLLSEGDNSWVGDMDLEQAIGESNTTNATVLEFDFLPISDKITFEYIFSSEQYYNYSNPSQCNYSDGFAFLLREAAGQNQYQNLAVVPGTSIPVKITTIRGEGTICQSANTAFFDAFNGTEHPTNFNGQTKILKAEATVVPGMLYHMKLVVADQGNSLYDSAIFLGGGSFSVEADLGPDRLFSTRNTLCNGENYILDATQQGSNNTYKWYKDGVLITGENQPLYTVTQQGTYEVEVNLGSTSCVVTGKVTVEYSPPVISQNTVLIQCVDGNSGIAVFNLYDAVEQITAGDNSLQVQGFYTSSYNAENLISVIQNSQDFTNTVIDQIVYARVEDQINCYSIAELTLMTTDNVLPPKEVVSCSLASSSVTASFDLQQTTTELQNQYGATIRVSYHITFEKALQGLQDIASPFINTEPAMQTIYARLENSFGCFGVLPVYLTVIPAPQLTGVSSETYCLNTFPTPLVITSGAEGNADDLEFLWSTGATTPAIAVTEGGVYIVDVTSTQLVNGQAVSCTSTKTITVLTSEAPQVGYMLSGFTGAQTVTITTDIPGNYLYSFGNQNGPYQESPVFENISGGIFSIYVMDVDGCGIVCTKAYILDFPNYFTPNFDGINDFWQVKGLHRGKEQLQQVEIYDRYGKIVHVLNLRSQGWDGNFRGRPLPSNDYWFKAIFIDGGIFKGHFTLKR